VTFINNIEQVYNNLLNVPTEDLLTILENKDTETYTETTLYAVKQILFERGVDIPNSSTYAAGNFSNTEVKPEKKVMSSRNIYTVIGAVIGIGLGKAFPGFFMLGAVYIFLSFLFWWFGKKTLPNSKQHFLPAASVLAALSIAMFVGAFYLHLTSFFYIDVALMLIGGMLLIMRPGLPIALIMALYQVACIISVLYLGNISGGTAANVFMRLINLYLLYSGFKSYKIFVTPNELSRDGFNVTE
jgi:hypothetical protein